MQFHPTPRLACSRCDGEHGHVTGVSDFGEALCQRCLDEDRVERQARADLALRGLRAAVSTARDAGWLSDDKIRWALEEELGGQLRKSMDVMHSAIDQMRALAIGQAGKLDCDNARLAIARTHQAIAILEGDEP